jgi:hypothetical protein
VELNDLSLSCHIYVLVVDGTWFTGTSVLGGAESLKNLILIYLNCASGAAPQQGVAALDGALALFHIFVCLFILIYFNCQVGAGPQQGVAAPERAPHFFFLSFFFLSNFSKS